MANRLTTVFFVSLLHCSFQSFGANYYWVAGSSSNWSIAANWSASSGGPGGAGVPGAGDNVFFNGANSSNGNCSVSSTQVVMSITVSGYLGTITIGTGFYLRAVGGPVTQTTGFITGGTLTSDTAFSLSGVMVGSDITGGLVLASSLIMTNVTVTGTVSLVLVAAASGTVTGCTFNNTVSFNNQTGVTLTLSNNIYNAATEWINSGTGIIRGSGETYNSDVTINNKSTGTVNPSYSPSTTTTYKGNLILNNTSNGIIGFGGNGGLSVFNNNAFNNNSISIATTGDNGQYVLRNLTYSATSPIAANVPNNATVRLAACTVAADVSITAKVVTLNANGTFGGNMFNGNVTLNMLGTSTTNHNISLSTFKKNTTITVTASALTFGAGLNTFGSAGAASVTRITLASNASLYENTDNYYGDVTIDGTDGGVIRLAQTGVSSYYANVHLIGMPNSKGYINLGTSTSTFALKSGFQMDLVDSACYFQLANFIVEGTTSPITWNCPTSDFSIQFSTFNSDVNITSRIFTSASITTYNGNFSLNVAASSASHNVLMDGNLFARTALITNNYQCTDVSPTNNKIFLTNNTFRGQTTFTTTAISNTPIYDNGGNVYNAPVTWINNSSTAGIYPANSGTNTYNSDLTINSSSPTVIGANAGGGSNGLLVFGGTGNRTFRDAGSATSTFNNTQFNFSGGKLTLNSNLTVAGAATFTSGIVTPATGSAMYFANNATTTGASDASYVEGQVFKTGNQAFTFPVGGGGYYRPLSISAPTYTTDQYYVWYLKGDPSVISTTYDPPIIGISTCESWAFDSSLSGSDVFVTLSWNAASCNNPGYVADPSSLVVAAYNNVSSSWQNKGNAGTTNDATLANGTVLSSIAVGTLTYNNWGNITLGTTSLLNPLPIELIDFNAVASDNSVEVTWKTASEVNSDYFRIERSQKGEVFEPVAKVNGKGTTNMLSTYSFLDDNPYEGISYYRLAHVDFDRTTTYSEVRVVTSRVEQWQVYPNPAKDVLHFIRASRVKLTDMMGSVLYESTDEIDTLDVSGLPTGTYLISSGVLVRKIIVVK